MLSASGTFSSFILFLHRNAHVAHEYLALTTCTNHTIHISRMHLLPIIECAQFTQTENINAYMYAHRARVGDCLVETDLRTKESVASRIVAIEIRSKMGLYAPVTMDGSIVVNHIHASVYSSVENHQLQHSVFSFLQSVFKILDYMRVFNRATPDIQIYASFMLSLFENLSL